MLPALGTSPCAYLLGDCSGDWGSKVGMRALHRRGTMHRGMGARVWRVSPVQLTMVIPVVPKGSSKGVSTPRQLLRASLPSGAVKIMLLALIRGQSADWAACGEKVGESCTLPSFTWRWLTIKARLWCLEEGSSFVARFCVVACRAERANH